jgi:hypothetical protein
MHPNLRSTATRPLRRGLAAGLLAAALLAGCGGGVSIGIGFDLTPRDDPPQVSLGVSRTAAFEGDPLSVTASASDDHRVSVTEIWQSNDGRVTLLADIHGPALTVATAMPFAPSGVVYYMARAVDDIGQVTGTAWTPVNLR